MANSTGSVQMPDVHQFVLDHTECEVVKSLYTALTSPPGLFGTQVGGTAKSTRLQPEAQPDDAWQAIQLLHCMLRDLPGSAGSGGLYRQIVPRLVRHGYFIEMLQSACDVAVHTNAGLTAVSLLLPYVTTVLIEQPSLHARFVQQDGLHFVASLGLQLRKLLPQPAASSHSTWQAPPVQQHLQGLSACLQLLQRCCTTAADCSAAVKSVNVLKLVVRTLTGPSIAVREASAQCLQQLAAVWPAAQAPCTARAIIRALKAHCQVDRLHYLGGQDLTACWESAAVANLEALLAAAAELCSTTAAAEEALSDTAALHSVLACVAQHGSRQGCRAAVLLCVQLAQHGRRHPNCVVTLPAVAHIAAIALAGLPGCQGYAVAQQQLPAAILSSHLETLFDSCMVAVHIMQGCEGDADAMQGAEASLMAAGFAPVIRQLLVQVYHTVAFSSEAAREWGVQAALHVPRSRHDRLKYMALYHAGLCALAMMCNNQCSQLRRAVLCVEVARAVRYALSVEFERQHAWWTDGLPIQHGLLHSAKQCYAALIQEPVFMLPAELIKPARAGRPGTTPSATAQVVSHGARASKLNAEPGNMQGTHGGAVQEHVNSSAQQRPLRNQHSQAAAHQKSVLCTYHVGLRHTNADEIQQVLQLPLLSHLQAKANVAAAPTQQAVSRLTCWEAVGEDALALPMPHGQGQLQDESAAHVPPPVAAQSPELQRAHKGPAWQHAQPSAGIEQQAGQDVRRIWQHALQLLQRHREVRSTCLNLTAVSSPSPAAPDINGRTLPRQSRLESDSIPGKRHPAGEHDGGEGSHKQVVHRYCADFTEAVSTADQSAATSPQSSEPSSGCSTPT